MMTSESPNYHHHNSFARFANFMGFSSHKRAQPTREVQVEEDEDWIHYNGPYEPPGAWATSPRISSPQPHHDTYTSRTQLEVVEGLSTKGRARSGSRSKVLSAFGRPSSPTTSPRQLAKPGSTQPQPTFLSLDPGLGGGIGESPQAVIRGRDSHRFHYQSHQNHGSTSTRRGSDTTIVSPISPSILGTIGGATAARTSLLGFGAPQTTSNFDSPRKAPAPPSYGSPPSVTNSHSPESLHFPTLTTISNRPRGNSLAPIPADEEFPSPHPGMRKRAATHGADESSNHGPTIVIPPLPTSQYSHPYAVAASPTQDPYSSTLASSPNKSPTAYSPITPITAGPSHRAISPSYIITPPEGHLNTHKPPIPPKSAATRTLQHYRTLKASVSTPNLAERAEQEAHAAHIRSKGKDKEVAFRSKTPSGAASILRGPVMTYPLTPSSSANQLHAQTICDAFMFPKPRFVAHVISPPHSPAPTKLPTVNVSPPKKSLVSAVSMLACLLRPCLTLCSL